MVPEPEKRIEQWLKQWAAHRRQAAAKPFEMHPATREMLMSEMRRVHYKPLQANNEPSLWPWLLRRLAWAGSGMAVFMLLAMVVLPHLQPDKGLSNKALQKDATSSTAVAQSPAVRKLGDPTQVALAKRLPTAPSAPQKTEKVETFSQPMMAGSADNRPQVAERAERARTLLTKAMAPSPEKNAMGRTTTPVADSLVQSMPADGNAKDLTAKTPSTMAYRVSQPDTTVGSVASSQLFAYVTAPLKREQFILVQAPAYGGATLRESLPLGLAETPKPSIKTSIDSLLASFSLEHEGTRVKLIGADNSVYSGEWSEGTNQFTATGTNIRSGQFITIKAHWLPGNPSLGMVESGAYDAVQNTPNTNVPRATSSLSPGLGGSGQPTRLSGWLIFAGQTNAFEAVSQAR